MLTIDKKYLDCNSADLVLDLGCGEGRHITGLLELYPQVNVVGLDLNKQDLRTTNNKLKQYFPDSQAKTILVEGSAFSLPFADDSINHIICSEVLEHIENYAVVLDEITRVLKPDGTLCVSVPRAWPEKICWWLSDEYHKVEGGHIRIFNSSTLQNEIVQRHFEFFKRHWAHALHTPYWWLKCAFWNRRDDLFLIRWYHKLLVWDLTQKPAITRWIERILNPICGKSVVLYFVKQNVPNEKN